MTFIMKKKKYKFSVTLTVEELSSVPFINSVLFVKCRLLQGAFSDVTDRREVEDHCVKWNKTFVFTFKTTAIASTGILDSCILRLSVRKETKGGKSFVKLGYYDLNLTSLAGSGLSKCRCLLEGYDSRHHRPDNSMLQVTVDIKLLAGDPCFKTPNPTCLTQKQGSTDILLESDIDPPIKEEHNGLSAPSGIVNTVELVAGNVISANGDLSQQQHVLPPPHHHSNGHTNTGSHQNGTGSNSNSYFNHFDQMTSSATSHTTSVGSTFDPFETGHSRSNSSQTSSSRISTGYNSLPSHSRQGSADSESTTNIRHQSSDIKFNSVDRVGNKRCPERTVKPVNGGTEEFMTGKKAIDSTRVSADQLVQELLQNNKLVESALEEPFLNDSNGGLELYVSRDGSATIGSRQSRPDDATSGAAFAVRTASTTKASPRKLNRV